MAIASPAVPQARHELRDLRQKLTLEMGVGLTVVGAVLTALYPADSPRVWGHFVLCLSLLVQGLAALVLYRRAWPLVHVVLTLGPTLTLARAMHVIGGAGWPPLAVLIVVLNFACDPRAGLVAALLNSGSLLLWASPATQSVSLALIWSVALIEWRLSRALTTALEWSEASEQRAMRLLVTLRERQGQLNRTLSALTEATRRLERVNRELGIARRHAEEARALKEQFVANVTHELRTPLNLIVGFAEMMYLAPETYEGVQWTPDLESDIGRLYRASKHLQSLVDDILDLARIDAGRLPMFRELQDLAPIIHEAVETVLPLLEQRHLSYSVTCAPDLPPLLVDRTRIRQVMLNLLNNAARFTDVGGIAVRAELCPEGVCVSVQDTGVGLAPEQLERIFEEFYQADGGGRHRGGTGLGLAVSRQFIELHGGRLWARSTPGEGSTFSFVLPLPGSLPQATSLLHVPAREPASRAPIIVVDPDPGLAHMLARYLGDYPLLPACDLPEAEALIDTERPQAVIINEEPQVHAIRNETAILTLARYNVPVFRCSIPSPGWLSRASGFATCLTKPLALSSLQPVLDRYAPVAGTILLVDDDPGFVSLLARMVRSLGFRGHVLSAYGGREAIELARRFKPQLVLVDLLMPEVDGFAVLRALQQEPGLEAVTFVAVTASSFGEDAVLRGQSQFAITRAGGLSTGTVAELLRVALPLVQPVYEAGLNNVSST
ncbi:MAG: hybrid sensor histidine kinase/response regulator [Anaerolineae bacterium]